MNGLQQIIRTIKKQPQSKLLSHNHRPREPLKVDPSTGSTLEYRNGFHILHLKGDIRRAHSSLIVEWVRYMKHLKNRYPYLFSLAVRTNPFDSEASAVIR